MQPMTRQVSPNEEKLAIAVDRAIYKLARHWIWLLSLVSVTFVALPLLAPFLMSTGYNGIAEWIYRAFSLICHQRPDRSFHLFEHQIAFCQRDLAIYTAFFLSCIIFALARRHIGALGLRGAILLSVPMALDGFTQLFGLRESVWELRLITGSLFAVGIAWLVLPRLEIGFSEIRRMLEIRFAQPVKDGRTSPL